MPPATIYLDHNATSPLGPEVLAAMDQALRDAGANPASSHAPGRRARQLLEDAREGAARILGADPAAMPADGLVFTSGGTEANNLAVVGIAVASIGGWQNAARISSTRPRIAISAIEHPSVAGPAEFLARLGWQVDRLPVTAGGVVCLDRAAAAITPETRLVSVMLGNNETGVLQPVGELAALCHSRGVSIHTDAVQVAGKLPLDFRGLGVDALTLSAHKFHGPRGIGALLCRPGLAVAPLHFGGHQQSSIRPGTEPVPLALGMYSALQWFASNPAARQAHLAELRDSFEAALRAGWPEVVIVGQESPRLPHTSCVAFPGLDRQAMFMALDFAGIACSTGSACASGSNEPSPVLTAMGCAEAVTAGALRFSFGMTNTLAEVAEAASRVLSVASDLRAQKNRRNATANPPRPPRKSL